METVLYILSGLFAAFGLIYLLVAPKVVIDRPVLLIAAFLLAAIWAVVLWIVSRRQEVSGETSYSIRSFEEMKSELRQTVETAQKSPGVRKKLIEYVRSMWADEEARLKLEKALSEILAEEPIPWLTALYAELLMGDGRWTDAEVYLIKAYSQDPSSDEVKDLIFQWVEARGDVDPFRVTEMMRRLAGISPQPWIYAIWMSHLLKMKKPDKAAEVLLKAIDSGVSLSGRLADAISALFAYLIAEGSADKVEQLVMQVGEKAPVFAKFMAVKSAMLMGRDDEAVDLMLEAMDVLPPDVFDALSAELLQSLRSRGREDLIARYFERMSGGD